MEDFIKELRSVYDERQELEQELRSQNIGSKVQKFLKKRIKEQKAKILKMTEIFMASWEVFSIDFVE